jgi:parafibromin
MTTETDPLLVLRQAIKSRSQITYANDAGPSASLVDATSLVINDQPYPKSTRTRYRKAGAPSDFYSLDAVYVAWLFRDAAGAEYMKQAREHGLAVGFVSVTERKHVVDWLEGRAPDSDRIAPLTCKSLLLYSGRISCMFSSG